MSVITFPWPCLQVEYSLRSGTGVFNIDPTSGLITLAKSVSTTPQTQTITVRASDRGQPQRSSEQSITIILTSSVRSGLEVSVFDFCVKYK